MKILSIDTAHGVCSVAIAEDGIILSAETNNEPSRQAEILFSIIGDLLKKSRLSYADIDAVAVDIGPGSFTGVRIGLAAARGVALAAQVQVIGITGFEALAYAAQNTNNLENLLVTFDARRGQVFSQFFDETGAGEELLSTYNEISALASQHSNLTLIGDGAHLVSASNESNGQVPCIIDNLKLPSAEMVALKAFDKINKGDYSRNPAPLYIRKPDAKLPKAAI